MGMKKSINIKRAGALILTAALTLEGMGAAVSSYADPGIPDSFTVDAIRAAGITDENFATAVYESIAMRILLGDYIVDDSWTVQEILENYNLSNLGDPEIEGNECGIKSIEGIELLKNCSEIYLNGNDIHDLTPLKRDADGAKLFFNTTNIHLEGGNYQNVIPAELIGTANGNITVDSAMTFEPVELHYLYGDLPKTVGLDFGVWIHGAEGGVFNSEYSTAESVNHAGVSWEPYADSVTRHTGTTISMPGNDGDFTVAANANQDVANGLPPTIHYWSDEDLERTLNVSYRYSFNTQFYRLLTETADVTVLSGIRFRKTDPDGEPVPGAEYALWAVPASGAPVRYPDNTSSWTTDSAGELIISGLPAGNYELRELNAPEGFQLNPDPVPVTVTVSPEAESSLVSAVAGGETSAALTSDDAVYTPVWDAVVSADGLTRRHYMTLKSGSVAEKTAAELGGDTLLRNGGPGITALKGEMKTGAELQEIKDRTKISVYAGSSILGAFDSAADARSAVNNLVANNGFTADIGNLRIEAVFVYEDQDPAHYAEAFQTDQPDEPKPDEPKPDEPKPDESKPDEPKPDEPKPDEPKPVPVENVKSIEVRKRWSEENHPLRILVRLLVILEDGTERVVGKIKALTESGSWTAAWSFKELSSALADVTGATDSDASNSTAASASNAGESAGTAASGGSEGTGTATPGNAGRSDILLFNEDGELLDGLVLDDLNTGLRVEEVDVPEGWTPEYSDPVVRSDGTAVFEILNRKEDTPEPEPEPEPKPEPEPEPEPGPEHPDSPTTPGDEPDHDRPSGGTPSGSGNPTPGPEQPPVLETAPSAPELKLDEVPENRKMHLPYGRIDRRKEKGIPKTGEPFSSANVGILFMIMALFAAVFHSLRKE